MSFTQKESSCEALFRSLGPTYHCCTPENHEIIFSCPQDYKAGMAILGICAKLFPTVRIYTFQLMSNHIHLVLSGEKESVIEFFDLFRERLNKYLQSRDRFVALQNLELKFNLIDSVDYFRSSIAYANRNGFVISENETPFSYPWGANPYYFEPMAKNYYHTCRRRMTVVEMREYYRGKKCDSVQGLDILEGVVSPMSFCDIETGEKIFRNAGNYFLCISRDVELYKNSAGR